MDDPPRYVLVSTPKKPCNHTLHGTLTFFTFGLWAPVWIVAALLRR